MASAKSEIMKALGAPVCAACGEVAVLHLSGSYIRWLCAPCEVAEHRENARVVARRVELERAEQLRLAQVSDTPELRYAYEAEYGAHPYMPLDDEDVPDNSFSSFRHDGLDWDFDGTACGCSWVFTPAGDDA